MAKDDWIKAAIANDAVVVEQLMRLKEPTLRATPPASFRPPIMLLPPRDWAQRQPRTKSVYRCVLRKEDHEGTGCSPATPLSWSGGTGSPSGTADFGLEESDLPSVSGSKGSGTHEATHRAGRKKPMKKQAFSELKHKEVFLLKERIYLQEEIAALRVRVGEHRTTNERLKRLKRERSLHSVELELESCVKADHACIKEQQAMEANLQNTCSSGECIATKCNEVQKNAFLLPDLNLMPPEDNPCY